MISFNYLGMNLIDLKAYSLSLSFVVQLFSGVRLRPYGLQHARLPCPSQSPGICSNSCPLSWWWHPAISSSVIPFLSCLQFFSSFTFTKRLFRIFTEKTDIEDEAPTFWPPDAKTRLTGKDPDTGKNWRQEEKGMTEDEMVGWHHRLNGHEFEQTPGDCEGQGSLAGCSPQGWKESDMTERLKDNSSNI